MKTNFTILFLLVACTLFAQRDPTRYTIDYSLNQSARFDNTGGNFEPALAHNVFAHVELASKRSSRFTFGTGFLRSHLIHRDYSGLKPYRDSEVHYYTDYLVVPVGIKFAFGSFYIHPEIGVSQNLTVNIKTYEVDAEMNRIDDTLKESGFTDRTFELHLSGFMTLGYEIKVGTMSILTGAKGYIVLHQDFLSSYGIGLMVGLKI